MNRVAAALTLSLTLALPAAARAEAFTVNPDAGNSGFSAVFDAQLGERINAVSSAVGCDVTYDEKTGIETPRVRVTLATGLSEAQCREINLGYRDWRTIHPEAYANREHEGICLEPKAGERLYHLRQKPVWAGG